MDFFAGDTVALEDMLDADIQLKLEAVIDEPKNWKLYKALFDNDVASSKEVCEEEKLS